MLTNKLTYLKLNSLIQRVDVKTELFIPERIKILRTHFGFGSLKSNSELTIRITQS